MEKILLSLTGNFENVVCVIEKSKIKDGRVFYTQKSHLVGVAVEV